MLTAVVKAARMLNDASVIVDVLMALLSTSTRLEIMLKVSASV